MNPRRLYRVCGRFLESAVDLPELIPAEGHPPDIFFELAGTSKGGAEPGCWFGGWRGVRSDGDWWVRFAEIDDGYLLRFTDYTDFILSADGARIRCIPQPGVPAFTVRHLLLDQVLPLTLSLGGELVLHGSGVAIEGDAVAFIGPTGSGKSTIAAAFAGAGNPLFADDCLVLKRTGSRWHALPYYPGVRLWPDNIEWLRQGVAGDADVAHYTSKQRVGARVLPFAGEALPLRCLFVLEGRDSGGNGSVLTRRVPPAETVIALLETSFLLEFRTQAVLKRQFEQLSTLSGGVAVYTLAVPRDYGALNTVRAAIIDVVSSCPQQR